MLKLQFQHLVWMTLASPGKRQQPPRPVQLLWSHQRVGHQKSGLLQLAMAAALNASILPMDQASDHWGTMSQRVVTKISTSFPVRPVNMSMVFITRRTQVVAVAIKIRVKSFNMQLTDLATRRFFSANMNTTIAAISA